MKWIIAISLLGMAFTTNALDRELPPGVKVQFDSWCEGDQVVAFDRDGIRYTVWDCYSMTDLGQCVENSKREGDWTVITASCK